MFKEIIPSNYKIYEEDFPNAFFNTVYERSNKAATS